jgi:hypothetical protein
MAIDNGVRGWPGPDDSDEVNFWRVREIKRLWREACESYDVCQRIHTPTGWTVAVPSIGQVSLGAPTVMTVQLRPGQRPEHLEALAGEIADVMGVGGLRVIPFRATWVRVELLARGNPGNGPASPVPSGHRRGPTGDGPVSPVLSGRRRGPSSAWTRRWHAPTWRRPEQPS